MSGGGKKKKITNSNIHGFKSEQESPRVPAPLGQVSLKINHRIKSRVRGTRAAAEYLEFLNRSSVYHSVPVASERANSPIPSAVRDLGRRPTSMGAGEPGSWLAGWLADGGGRLHYYTIPSPSGAVSEPNCAGLEGRRRKVFGDLHPECHMPGR